MKLARSIQLLRHLGPRWAWFRLAYAWRRRTGGLERRTPRSGWPEGGSGSGSEAEGWRAATIGPGCLADAEAVLEGRYPFFSHQWVEAGLRPDWHASPITGDRAPGDRHWSRLGDAAYGDIKLIWELGRFAWAFALARAYASTGSDRFAAGFWRLFEHWARENPPNQGPHWMCGQEVTFRLFAVVFARGVFRGAGSSGAEREALFRGFVRASGQRIAANLDYALSQSNNHGISECVGLWTASRWTPDPAEARVWRGRASESLRRQLAELVYDDGGFAQHSVNYHRVLVHDLTWCVSEHRRWGESPPAWLIRATLGSASFLEGLMTPETGHVPLYGANDGANVLPLSDCGYLDFRPAVQAAYAVVDGRRRLPSGSWDEAAEWLAGPTEDRVERGDEGGPTRVRWESRPGGGRSWHAPDAGCLTWWHGAARLFLRCPTRFRHRPSQADQLHVDLEWRGCPIAHDAGTYSYAVTDTVGEALKSARCHNGLTVDGLEPMRKVSRFLYLPWPGGTAGWVDAGNAFEASHEGYRGVGISHARRIGSPGENRFVVEDRVVGTGQHRARVHWLLADVPYAWDASGGWLVLTTPAGQYRVSWDVGVGTTADVVRGDGASARGWWSPEYRRLLPAVSLAVEVPFEGELVFRTRFEPVER